MAKNRYSDFKSRRDMPYNDNYPRARKNRYRRRYSRSAKVRRVKQAIAGVCAFILLIGVGYIATSTFINISKKPVEKPTAPAETVTKAPENNATAASPSVQQTESTVALYLPEKVLRNSASLTSFLDNAKKIGANAVVIDVKKEDGMLLYKSQMESANKVGSSANGIDDFNAVIKTIHDSNIKVIAKIYCFKDTTAPYRLSKNSYVHYNNTESPWIDNSVDKGGKRWLNPYSEEAQNYLLDVIGETAVAGVDEIILDGVQFPSGYGLSYATYPGEKESGKTRNQIIKSFISQALRAAGNTPTAVAMTASGSINGNEQFYGGTLTDVKDVLFSPDLRMAKVENSVTIGEEKVFPKANPAEFTAKISAQLSGVSSQLIPLIDAGATLSDQVKALNSAGINSYILYNEQGNYSKVK